MAQTAMVQVHRKDFEEKAIHNWRTGKVIRVIPKFYECRYTYGGREIATYNSNEDVLRLNSTYLDKGIPRSEWSTPVYDRAVRCEYKEAFGYLFEMLGCDKSTKMSEYFNL